MLLAVAERSTILVWSSHLLNSTIRKLIHAVFVTLQIKRYLYIVLEISNGGGNNTRVPYILSTIISSRIGISPERSQNGAETDLITDPQD